MRAEGQLERLSPPRKRSLPRLLRALEAGAQRLGRGPAMTAAQTLGQRGEELAFWRLRERGYTIVARNFRRSQGPLAQPGEIDLIGWDGDTLAFIEVKTRAREQRPFPGERAVDQDKRRHLARLARYYRRRHGYTGPYRFDVMIIYGPEEENPELRLYRGAFRG